MCKLTCLLCNAKVICGFAVLWQRYLVYQSVILESAVKHYVLKVMRKPEIGLLGSFRKSVMKSPTNRDENPGQLLSERHQHCSYKGVRYHQGFRSNDRHMTRAYFIFSFEAQWSDREPLSGGVRAFLTLHNIFSGKCS